MYNDADIETMRFQQVANQEMNLRKMNICCHGYRQELEDGVVLCLECRKVFKSVEDADEERNERLC
jgi:hypothetical protein